MLAEAQVVDRAASVAAFGQFQYPMLKHADDLARYTTLIEASAPEVVVETGSWGGHSARWFLDRPGVSEVITIDVDNSRATAEVVSGKGRVTFLRGNSIHPQMLDALKNLVGGRRCMVSLDSDHSETHVRREIELYRELVSIGCYLVVEDGVIDWLPSPKPHSCDVYSGSVLAAIGDTLPGDGRFMRNMHLEALTPVTMSPAGWWVRHG